MTKQKARKGTFKPRNINPKKKAPTKRDEPALKRVVARVLDDASAAIDEIVETLVQEAMLYASGEDDDPDYQAYAAVALRIACESTLIPKLLAKTGKEVLTPDYVRSVVAGFC